MLTFFASPPGARSVPPIEGWPLPAWRTAKDFNGRRRRRTTSSHRARTAARTGMPSLQVAAQLFFFINSSNIISFEFWSILHAVTPAHAFFLHVVAARLPELCVSLPLLLLLAVFGFVVPAEPPGGRFACLQIPSGSERQQYATLQLMDRDVQLI